MSETNIRHNWTIDEIKTLFEKPFMDLVLQAQQIHREHFSPNTVQVCTLHNIKVGGCPEDCHWCGQSVYHGVKSEPLESVENVKKMALNAKTRGATRICLAASWRGPTERNLDKVIEMVKEIKDLGLEACITIGKLTGEQAQKLKENGLDYYNHNLESSENHFAKVSTTRSYQDRLDTLAHVRTAGMKVCSGGILGLGETLEDRFELLKTLANQPTHPQSVPINQLVRVKETPLENAQEVDEIDFVRCIALARLLMPKAYVRLSGGRVQMSKSMQALCFLAGANSIHFGSDKLLITPNVDASVDVALFDSLGLRPEPSAPHTASSNKINDIPCVLVNE